MGSRRFVLFGRWREPESPAHALAERVSAALRGDPTPEERKRVGRLFAELCSATVKAWPDEGIATITTHRHRDTGRLTWWETMELYRLLPVGATLWQGVEHGSLDVGASWGTNVTGFGDHWEKVPREGDAPGTGATDMPGAS